MAQQLRKFIFKRDKAFLVDSLAKNFESTMLIGDILFPFLFQNIVDEVRFEKNQIRFLKDGTNRSYRYQDIKTEISHLSSKDKLKRINICFTARDGEVYKLDLHNPKNKASMAGFSKHKKDFLYRVITHMPRLRERRMSNACIMCRFVLVSALLSISAAIVLTF